MANKTVLIRNLDEGLHAVAKTIAAHQGISLDKLIKDAIEGYCLRVAHEEGMTEWVIEQIERGKGDTQ